MTASNIGATAEDGEPNHDGFQPSSSIWYSWVAPLSTQFRFDTGGSNFGTVLGISTATGTPAQLSSLTEIGGANDGDGTGAVATFDAIANTTYYIAVDGISQAQGSVHLHWLPNPPPNDNVATPTPLYDSSGSVSQQTFGATAESGEFAHAGNTASHSVWFVWSGGDGHISIDTFGSNYDTVLAVYTLIDPNQPVSMSNLAPLVSNDDSGDGPTSEVSFPTSSDTTYYIAVDGYSGASGNLTLNWAVTSDNNDWENATVIPSYEDNGTLDGSNVGADKQNGEPDHGGNSGGKSIWYTFTARGNGKLLLDTGNDASSSAFDTLLGVYTGDSVEGLTAVAGGSNDNRSSTVLTSQVTVNVVGGTTYYIAIDGKDTGSGAASGLAVLDWAFTPQAPSNNNFSNAVSLSGTSGSVSGNNIAATRETGEPNHDGQSGGNSVWYAWKATQTRRVNFTCSGINFYPILGLYKASGSTASVSTLSTVASADTGAVASFGATAGVTYYIAVDGYYDDDTGLFALNWTTSPANDDFSTAQTISGNSGSTTGTTVNATYETDENTNGYDSIWYQWKSPFTGTVTFNTSGSENPTFLGIYTSPSNPAKVSNLSYIAYGSDDNTGASTCTFAVTSGVLYYISVQDTTSLSGAITLNWIAAPANNYFASAQQLSGDSGTFSGTNFGTTLEDGEPTLWTRPDGSSGSSSVWFKWSPSTTGNRASFDTSGSDFDTAMAVYTGSDLASLTAVTSNDNAGGEQTSAVTFAPIAGQTYYIAVDGMSEAQGNLQLNWAFAPGTAPSNDLFANAQVLSGTAGSLSTGNINATSESGEPLHANTTGGASIWFGWRAPASGLMSIDTIGSGINTLLGVYTGPKVSSLSKIVSNDDANGATSSAVTFNAIEGTLYYIAIDGKYSQGLAEGVGGGGQGPAEGPITLNWSLVANPPTITSFSPTSGRIGTKVTILGHNLSVTDQIQLNGVDMAYTLFAGKIIATVPVNATSGPITITNVYGTASRQSFTVTTPAFYSYSPGGAPVGSVVTIKGLNFTGVSGVTFNGVSAGPMVSNLATATSGFQIVSSTQIRARVPAAAASGPITITNAGEQASNDNFIVVPTLTGLSSTSGRAEAIVTLSGKSFQDVDSVTFHGNAAQFIINSPTQITAIVPGGTTTGPVKLTASGWTSNTLDFTITTPILSSFSPARGAVGSIVNINGSGLSGVTSVKFNGVSVGAAVADINSAASGFQIVSNTQIKAKVPAQASDGLISISNAGGTINSGSAFAVAPAITGFSPSSGEAGTTVTISGTTFGIQGSGVSRVQFNGIQADYVLNASNKITAIVPTGATTGPITVTSSDGSGTSAANFTVTSAKISSFSPATGSSGTVVTLQGLNFSGTSSVKFNGTSAGAAVADISSATTGFQVVSDTQILVKVPAKATTGKITVTTASGTSSSSSNFTPISPALTGFSPSGGPAGTVVVISGVNLSGATAVKFNTANATSFTVNSATKITATVPTGATTGKIIVTTPSGTVDTGTSLYTVSTALPPSVSSFTPASGAAGTIVILTGTNFTGTTAVKFNGVSAGAAVASIATAAAGFQIVSNTQIRAKVPAAATYGPISVTNAAGTATGTGNFVVLPTIASFSPSSGAVGATVTINGSGFGTRGNGVAGVAFNGVAASFVFNSSGRLYATVPPGATTGPITLTISGGNGAGSTTSNSNFTVTTPVISSFTPPDGGAGTVVNLTGTGFSGAIAVKFNGVSAGAKVADINSAATGFQIVSNTQIKVKVPSTATTGPISVSNAAGTSSSATAFTVLPSVTSMSPTRGAPGTVVTLTGAALSDVNFIDLNGTDIPFLITSANRILVKIPAGATTGPFRLYNLNGSSTTSLFTVAPYILSFSPSNGADGDIVTLTGSNFSGATSVLFNGVSAGPKVADITSASTGFQITSDYEIDVRVPAKAKAGLIEVVNASASPSIAGYSATAFAVAPYITSFTPVSGATGTTITITGVNFSTATAVLFCGDPSTRLDDRSAIFTVVSDTQITAMVPTRVTTGPLRVYGATVGNFSASIFKAAPLISSFSPASGAVGSSVVINGANFSGASAVKFNGVAATSFTVNTDGTQITTTVPSGSVTGPISVTTSIGSSSSNTNFTLTTSALSAAHAPQPAQPANGANLGTNPSAGHS